MSRYIDADKLKSEFPIRRSNYDEEHGDVHYINGIESVFEYIDYMPTADVEKVRHGKWIEEQAQHVVYRLKCRAAWVKYTCPFCGKKNGRYKSNYCSNCGAKMDGGAQ